MQEFQTIIGAAVGSATIAVLIMLWIHSKFEKLEKRANAFHLENIGKFNDINMKLLRLELRNDRKDQNDTEV